MKISLYKNTDLTNDIRFGIKLNWHAMNSFSLFFGWTLVEDLREILTYLFTRNALVPSELMQPFRIFNGPNKYIVVGPTHVSVTYSYLYVRTLSVFESSKIWTFNTTHSTQALRRGIFCMLLFTSTSLPLLPFTTCLILGIWFSLVVALVRAANFRSSAKYEALLNKYGTAQHTHTHTHTQFSS